MTSSEAVNPIGSFADPEYAQVGLTEAKARATCNVVISNEPTCPTTMRSNPANLKASDDFVIGDSRPSEFGDVSNCCSWASATLSSHPFLAEDQVAPSRHDRNCSGKLPEAGPRELAWQQ
jgi:hypothetical protein